ncbi:Clavaminate synthase-like protein [Epithele typhae]|uniref:Clavaminate synthase-like protein n=1 Tax=Epithele typhae TaxID=378194 RepID=UPI0020072790|nr:Clavaminate synthase-like protein [Epithele typhae]KAH9918577.1 Clavaminate synthase-like protein [Epithele typhae]
MARLLSLPPFPDDVPIHPLLIIDYELLLKRDDAEIDKLWKASTELGFWYLKNHGVDPEVDEMFEMGAETMRLPLEEKMQYEQGDEGMSFGYKAAGANATNETGALDTVEFINVAKDDALAWPARVHREYPSTVNARMESTIRPFVRKSLAVNMTLLNILNDRLGLPEGTLATRHKLEEPSGSEARTIKNPPRPNGMTEEQAAIGAHTDFGSLSFLHNRLGGLQVMVPGTNEWQYVRPIPGHAICNLGDAMAIFSGGILRSNLHRVVPPPKEQGKLERWSLVFFTRPGNSQVLRPLSEDCTMIAEAAAKDTTGRLNTGSTSAEWFSRRIKNQRIKNRTGPETWRSSRGTEHRPSAA